MLHIPVVPQAAPEVLLLAAALTNKPDVKDSITWNEQKCKGAKSYFFERMDMNLLDYFTKNLAEVKLFTFSTAIKHIICTCLEQHTFISPFITICLYCIITFLLINVRTQALNNDTCL